MNSILEYAQTVAFKKITYIEITLINNKNIPILVIITYDVYYNISYFDKYHSIMTIMTLYLYNHI